jgi:hypothetical protein
VHWAFGCQKGSAEFARGDEGFPSREKRNPRRSEGFCTAFLAWAGVVSSNSVQEFDGLEDSQNQPSGAEAFCVCARCGTTEQLAEKVAELTNGRPSGAKARLILKPFRHDQGRALIQKQSHHEFFRMP